jgi:hypothetical protein
MKVQTYRIGPSICHSVYVRLAGHTTDFDSKHRPTIRTTVTSMLTPIGNKCRNNYSERNCGETIKEH